MDKSRGELVEDLYMAKQRIIQLEQHRQNMLEAIALLDGFIKEHGLHNQLLAYQVANRLESDDGIQEN